jgi:hypothetical protein
MWASHFGHIAVVKLLLAAGANVQLHNAVSEFVGIFVSRPESSHIIWRTNDKFFPDSGAGQRSCRLPARAIWRP